MERLTEKHYAEKGYYIKCSETCEKSNCDTCVSMADIVDRLGEYEDAEEQGLLVRLPCKVGAPIYSVGMAVDECPCVDEFEVNSFEYCEDEAGNLELWVYCAIGFHFRSDAMGKTVFLTREEAEAALKEG